MRNSWPGGYRHAMDQDAHRSWNGQHYPGTRQLCVECEKPTGRCEDDSIFTEEGHGPLCVECRYGKEDDIAARADELEITDK